MEISPREPMKIDPASVGLNEAHMSTGWKRIMCAVIDFSKRWGPIFFSAFIALAIAIVPAQIWIANPLPTIIVLTILASICLVASLVSLYYDLREVYRKHKASKGRPPAIW